MQTTLHLSQEEQFHRFSFIDVEMRIWSSPAHLEPEEPEQGVCGRSREDIHLQVLVMVKLCVHNSPCQREPCQKPPSSSYQQQTLLAMLFLRRKQPLNTSLICSLGDNSNCEFRIFTQYLLHQLLLFWAIHLTRKQQEWMPGAVTHEFRGSCSTLWLGKYKQIKRPQNWLK